MRKIYSLLVNVAAVFTCVFILGACGSKSDVITKNVATNSFNIVKVTNGQFQSGGRPFRFIGANFWQGAELGRPDAGGDRPRLIRELDRLKATGVTVLRVVAANQGPDTEAYRYVPSTEPAMGVYVNDGLIGLDFLLSEMKKREMRAVLILNNFWQWSGGMSQYVSWATNTSIPYVTHWEGSVQEYMDYTSQFYGNSTAVNAANHLISTIVSRKNSITDQPYVSDPTIFSWELANEARPRAHVNAFSNWIKGTSALIRSLDPSHMITTGVEGDTPYISENMDLIRDHAYPNIDYATMHFWAKDWGYHDSTNPKIFQPTVNQFHRYVSTQIAKAKRLKKPLVLEEFGFARDGDSYDPCSTTQARDTFYQEVFERMKQEFDDVSGTSPLQGVSFWAWSGEGRPKIPGGKWQPGDALIGDPPHEPQGMYGIYNTDVSTLSVIKQYTSLLNYQDSLR